MFTSLAVEELIRQTVDHTFPKWAIGPEGTSSKAIEFRRSLHERYLEPNLTKQSQDKAHLASQARGVPVPPLKSAPILLFAGEKLRRRIATSSGGCIDLDT